MKQTLKLFNPIEINGALTAELTYDTDEITARLFAEAEAKKLMAAGSPGNRAGAAAIDYTFQLYLGFAAIIAVNSGIDMSDLERLKGRDVMEVQKIGLNFTISRSEETSAESDSDEPSEIMPESSTPLSESWSENG